MNIETLITRKAIHDLESEFELNLQSIDFLRLQISSGESSNIEKDKERINYLRKTNREIEIRLSTLHRIDFETCLSRVRYENELIKNIQTLETLRQRQSKGSK